VSPGRPAGVKLSLLNAVLDPIVAHVHSLGIFLEYCFVGNSICGGVVRFELCCILWMSHLPDSFSRYSASFGIDKYGTIPGFSDGGNNMFQDSGLAQQGSV
jgi:hypothetical protein